MRPLIVLLLANQLVHQIPLLLRLLLILLVLPVHHRPPLLPPTPHHRPLKPQPQTHTHPVPKRPRQRLPKPAKVKLCQEPQTPQRKAQHRGHNPLKQPARIQHRPVPAQRNHKVKRVRPRATHVLVPRAQPPAHILPLAPRLGLGNEPLGVKQAVRLDAALDVHRVVRGLRQQPGRQLARHGDELAVVDLCEDEDGLDAELETDAAEAAGELADAPGHFRELFLGEEAGVEGWVGGGVGGGRGLGGRRGGGDGCHAGAPFLLVELAGVGVIGAGGGARVEEDAAGGLGVGCVGGGGGGGGGGVDLRRRRGEGSLGVLGSVEAGLFRDVAGDGGRAAAPGGGPRVPAGGPLGAVVVVVVALFLALEELVDEAFRLGGGVAVEVGDDGFVGDEGALAAVGVGRVKEDLAISRLAPVCV